jgi:divalent metal cation (Fe/Co/Zn/Cd) transporter
VTVTAPAEELVVLTAVRIVPHADEAPIVERVSEAAVIADGYHARTDGWTSLAVLVGATGVGFGYSLADPITGLVITVAILSVVWECVTMVFSRILDGVERRSSIKCTRSPAESTA